MNKKKFESLVKRTEWILLINQIIVFALVGFGLGLLIMPANPKFLFVSGFMLGAGILFLVDLGSAYEKLKRFKESKGGN